MKALPKTACFYRNIIAKIIARGGVPLAADLLSGVYLFS
jgi:hypothetical protein